MAIIIRPARMEDFPSVQEIELLSYTAPWSKEILESELLPRVHNYTLVAESQEAMRVVGHCFFWMPEGDEVHLNNLAVHPEWRRRGIARRLLHECIACVRSHGFYSITLEVREQNLAAQQFYAQEGFVVVGRRKEYYRNPKEDALILRMHLPGLLA